MLNEMKPDWPERFSGDDESVLTELLEGPGRQIAVELTRHYSGVLAEDEAEQIVLEAFARAWRCRLRFDLTKGPLDAWLRRIAKNIAADWAKSGWAKARCLEVRLDQKVLDAYPAPNSQLLYKAAATTSVQFVVQVLNEILAQLPERQRTVLEIDPLGEISSTELAQELGISPATVRVHRKRGMDAIRRAMNERMQLSEKNAADILGLAQTQTGSPDDAR